MSRLMRHWVCFDCRKQFRKPVRVEKRRGGAVEAEEEPSPCPVCRQPMTDMGRYFRPPAKTDRRSWAHLRRMAEHGTRFRTEGSVAWMQFVLHSTTGKLDAAAILRNCPCRARSGGRSLLQSITCKYGPRKRAGRRGLVSRVQGTGMHEGGGCKAF